MALILENWLVLLCKKVQPCSRRITKNCIERELLVSVFPFSPYIWRFSKVGLDRRQGGVTRMADSPHQSCHNSIKARQCHNSIREGQEPTIKINLIHGVLDLRKSEVDESDLKSYIPDVRSDYIWPWEDIQWGVQRSLSESDTLGNVHVECLCRWCCLTVGLSEAWLDGQWHWEGGNGMRHCSTHPQCTVEKSQTMQTMDPLMGRG